MNCVKAICLPLLVILLAAPAVAQTTAHFIGPDGGLWSDSTNWDLAPGLVPADGGGDTYNVIIPTGMTVVFDLPTPTQITGMSMETGSGLDLTDTSLEIIGVALLENIHINATGADAEFLTNSPFVSGESQRLQVENGATVRLALPKYILSNNYLTEYDLGGPFLSSSDNNSTLNLSSLTEIDATQVARGNYSVLASNGGDINLSNVSTLKGAGGNARMKFRAESNDSSIDLSGLRQITEGNTWFQLAGGSIDLSILESVVNTRFDVPSGETLDLGIGVLGNGFTTATGSEFLLENGAIINAPNLTDFSNSSITLTPTTILNAPLFTQIDNAQLHVKEGRSFEVADTEYILSNNYLTEYDLGGPFLSSSDNNSTLNLSSLTEIDATQVARGNYAVLASNGGDINLSNVTTLKGAGGNARLKFRAESGGSSIDLSGLENIIGGNTWFELAGGSIDLPSLETSVNMRIDVPIFQALNLPMLTSTSGSKFKIENGGAVNAPNLTDFTNSSITLTPTTILNAPLFTQIDNAQLHVKEGRSFEVADTEYILSNNYLTEYDLGGPFLSSNDSNSTLNLSSLTEIDATQVARGNYAVLASNGGDINLSNVTTLKGAGGGAWLKFRAESGGSIDFGSFGPTSRGVWLDTSGSNSKITFTGDLVLGRSVEVNVPENDGLGAIRNPKISASALGEFHIGGDMIVLTNDPALHDTSGGTLFMEGSGVQRFEVNGDDIGLPTDTIDDNFNWGQMVVGQAGQATTVVLMDFTTFSDVGLGSDALYLSGFPQGENGLSILGGSTLVLNGLEAYIGAIDGDEAEWIHLNSLFDAGENVIPFGDGFLQLAVTSDLISSDFDGDGDVDADDLAAWTSSYGANAGGDTDYDGDTDGHDFLNWQRNFSGGTGTVPTSTTVPEPATAILLSISVALFVAKRRS